MPRKAVGTQGYGELGRWCNDTTLEGLETFCASGPRRQSLCLIPTAGNIRVLCRLRPGTPSSLISVEPGPGGTVTTCYRGRQRRFCLDWVFPPDATQEEVRTVFVPVLTFFRVPWNPEEAYLPFSCLQKER